MKIITYDYQGTETYGVVEGEGVIDVGASLGDRYPSLLAVLRGGALDEVRDVAQGQKASASLDVEY